MVSAPPCCLVQVIRFAAKIAVTRKANPKKTSKAVSKVVSPSVGKDAVTVELLSESVVSSSNLAIPSRNMIDTLVPQTERY